MSTGTPVVVSRIQNRRGTQAQFDALYPAGYLGVGGYESTDFPDFTQQDYPNVLRSGELALCTDTRKMFMGNINGEYIFLSASSDPIYNALQIVLPPAASFTDIAELAYSATPFLSILYSLTDALGATTGLPALPDAVGIDFSRNGELKITAKQYTAPTDATLVDASVEINSTLYDISFKAEYLSASTIQISYTHNFPGDLTLSTNTIIWAEAV